MDARVIFLLPLLVLRGHFRNAIMRIVAGRLQDDSRIDELVDLVYLATSFESYDTLAGANRGDAEAADLMRQLVLAVFQRYEIGPGD